MKARSRRRAAGTALCLLAASVSVLLAAGPAAAASDLSCRDDGVNDTVNASSGQVESHPAADIYRMCISSDGTNVVLSATVAPGSPPMTDRARLGATTMRWEVATESENGSPESFVVSVDASGAKVFTAAEFRTGGVAVCSSTEPMADEAGFRTSVSTECFPGAATLIGTPFLSFDADPDDPGSPLYLDGSEGSTTGQIYNGLSAVDIRYVDLGGSASPLGAPVAAPEFGRYGTTERRQYERGIISQSDDITPLAWEVHGTVYAKYRSMAEEGGPLGRPTSGQNPIRLPSTPSLANVVSQFEGGAIYSHTQLGVHEVHGAIAAKYSWPRGLYWAPVEALGFPLTDELTTPDGVGRYNHFERGSIYWTPTTGAHAVQASFRDVWGRLGWERGPLGYPTSDRFSTADFRGAYTHFQNGSMYELPEVGVREVHGSIKDTWNQLGEVRSVVGYPTTDESAAPDARGRYNHFERGSIYWTPTTGAREVRGAIRDSWSARGWERGLLGYPTTNELTTPDGRGRYNHFEGGSIYWTSTTGANEVRGAIRETWARRQLRPYVPGWEAGPLGYPRTDELGTPDGRGRYNHFEHGSIYWTARTGAWAVRGALGAYWASSGWERGSLGYPVGNEQDAPGGRAQYFERGSLFWNATTGAVTRTS